VVTNKTFAVTCQNILCSITSLQQRLLSVTIENLDFRQVFKNYDKPESFFYCDPPHVPGTRKSGKYTCEMSDTDHADLVELLNNMRGKFLLSGYENDLYNSQG